MGSTNAYPPPPPTSSCEVVENDNRQPPIACSPAQASVPSPLTQIDYVDHHQQFTNSISTSPPQQPENSTDRQQYPPSEDAEGQQEPPVPQPLPEEKVLHHQPSAPPSPSALPPPSPPPTIAEQPPENFNLIHESALSKQPPSRSTPPTRPENPVVSPNYHINPNPTSNHAFPLSKQLPSPSPSTRPSGPDDPAGSPNYRENLSLNPNSDHESPSPSSPAEFQADTKAKQLPEEPSLSPQLTPESPSSPQGTLEPNTDLTPLPPLGVPLLLQAVAGSSSSKPQISPWTQQETANLIQAYQEKWYSLNKGPLKAGQWEEVAITVAARCGYDEPTKTSKQCRHKIEKLRKRYRAERGKPRSKATAWNFFKLMDDLEKGPLPISSSQPMALVEYQKPSNSNGKKRNNDDVDVRFLVNKRSSRSKNSNHHVSNDDLASNLLFSDGRKQVVRGLRTAVVHKHREFYQEDEEEGVVAQLAAEIKGFAENFVKMENKKIEMIRDVERYRLEMENKRIEMILETQQMLVETVNKAFKLS